MQGMASFAETRRNTRWVLLVLALLALVMLAAALWYVSTLVADPVGSTEGAAKTEGYSHEFSIYGSGPDRLHRPTEVATDADGNLYVADSFKNRIAVFDSKGGFLRTFGSPANVDGALRYPSSVVVDDRGRAYVTSSEPGRIVIYKPDGTVLKALDVPDPLTMAIKGNRLYVATSKGILIGDLDGNQIGQLLSHGTEPGQIDRPTGIAVGDDGTIYLADSLNYRFQAVDAKGKSKWVVGTRPDGATAVTDKNREFGLPSGLVLASDNVLYGIDAFNGEIIMLSTDGDQLGTYGAWGRRDGEFYYPTGITQVGSETFAIADTFNDRVQIVGIPSPQPDVAITSKRFAPGLALLLPLLLLLLLFRRPVAVVIDTAGLRRADFLGALPDLLQETKVLYAPAGTLDDVAELIAARPRLAEVLLEVEVDDLADDEDPALAIGRGFRGRMGLRRVALAFPDSEQEDAASEYGIGAIGVKPEEGTVAIAQ